MKFYNIWTSSHVEPESMHEHMPSFRIIPPRAFRRNRRTHPLSLSDWVVPHWQDLKASSATAWSTSLAIYELSRSSRAQETCRWSRRIKSDIRP